MISNVTTVMTAEEVFEIPEKPEVWRFELIDGELVEVPGAGVLHTLIVGLIYRLLHAHATEHHLGLVFPDGVGYILARNPDTLRVPDGSFVSAHRISRNEVPLGFMEIAPDLVVEVVSPGNSAAELRRRTLGYLDAGVPLIWIVWPDNHMVTVYAGNFQPTELGPDDTLDGGEVLPGFSVRVAELFDIEW